MDDEWAFDPNIVDTVVALITATINEVDIEPILQDAFSSQESAVGSVAIMTAIIQMLVETLAEDHDQTMEEMWARIASHIAASRHGLVPPGE